MKTFLKLKTLVLVLTVALWTSCDNSSEDPLSADVINIPIPNSQLNKRSTNLREYNLDHYEEDFKCSWFEYKPYYSCPGPFTGDKPWLNQVLWLDIEKPTVPWYFYNAKIKKLCLPLDDYPEQWNAVIKPGGYIAMNFIYDAHINKLHLNVFPEGANINEQPTQKFDIYVFKGGQWQPFKLNQSIPMLGDPPVSYEFPVIYNGAAFAIVAPASNIHNLLVGGFELITVEGPVVGNP